jgi:hypothetical protein
MRRENCRPTPQQELLLDAILRPGVGTFESWRKELGVNGIDDIDHASIQVLPQLYWSLKKERVDAPMMGRLKGVYRRAWAKNQWLLRQMMPALQSLYERRISILLLKGTALNVLYGKRCGIRLVGDMDVLVKEEDAVPAVAAVAELGWHPKGHQFAVTSDFVSVSKGMGLEHDNGGSLDLHWHMFREDLVPGSEQAVWQNALSTSIGGVPILAPSPTDMLLHVCVHGWAWCRHPPFRWVVDAMTVMECSGSQVDWDRLVANARRRRLSLRLQAALAYLQERFDADVPRAVLDGLSAGPVTRMERWEYRLKTRGVHTPLGEFILHLARLNRLRDDSGFRGWAFGLLEYLRRRWRLDSMVDVPIELCVRMLRRTMRRLSSQQTFRGDANVQIQQENNST